MRHQINGELMGKNQLEIVLRIARKKGILRTCDLKNYAIDNKILTRLVRSGQLIRVGRGLYRLPDMEYETPHYTYAEIQKRFPKSVICLISALAFHEITTQIPMELWLAIGEKDWRPKSDSIPIRVVRFSKQALKEGVQLYPIEGVSVQITNPARTVADCFKYRNKIGMDVAIESLKEGLTDRRFTRDEIWQYSKFCRVNNVMRPYLESMT